MSANKYLEKLIFIINKFLFKIYHCIDDLERYGIAINLLVEQHITLQNPAVYLYTFWILVAHCFFCYMYVCLSGWFRIICVLDLNWKKTQNIFWFVNLLICLPKKHRSIFKDDSYKDKDRPIRASPPAAAMEGVES